MSALPGVARLSEGAMADRSLLEEGQPLLFFRVEQVNWKKISSKVHLLGLISFHLVPTEVEDP